MVNLKEFIKDMSYKEWKYAKSYIDMCYEYEINIDDSSINLGQSDIYEINKLNRFIKGIKLEEWMSIKTTIDSFFVAAVNKVNLNDFDYDDIDKALSLSHNFFE